MKTVSDEALRPSDAVTGIEFSSFVDVLRHRAATQPNDIAYIFLPDRGGEPNSLTFAELYTRARALAQSLAARCEPGDRAVLLFPPGLDFIVAFFGCLLAGVIAVPMMVPRRDASRDASAAIVADCRPRFAMTRHDFITSARPDLAERFQNARFDWVLLDSLAEHAAGQHLSLPGRRDTAFLQYTSGSTSAPKGVVVSHGNLLDNSEMIRIAFGNRRNSTYVSWVPLYHDMGLILNVLQALYVGALCVLMAPVSFMQRPLSWLRAIHDYRAEVAGGPNFAFDLCVRRHRAEEMRGIDLSCWRVAFNGAEPVRAKTIEQFAETFAPYGFSPKSSHPAYGMAEATLMISTGRRGAGPVMRTVSRDALRRHRVAAPARREDLQTVVACGRQLCGERVVIVEPESRTRLPAGSIGEIWVAGPNVAQGYWRNELETNAVFRAQIESEGAERWLRTGDLGFVDENAELFITGRIKGLIIIRGINHYPEDIEETVQDCHPALRRHCGAAFGVLGDNDEEQLVVVQEVERTYRQQIAGSEIIGSIREAIVRNHDIAAREIALIRPGALPKTTSGKIQRRLTRQLFLTGALAILE